MPLKVGKRVGGKGEDRRKREAVNVDKDLLLQAEWREESPSQGGEVVFWDENNLWVGWAWAFIHP